MISLLGCLPFYFSGEIPSFVDALFETVSGFTTTGASILSDVEALSKGILYWRSFTHWLGGMGVLVFVLALGGESKKSNGYTMHLLRAESPGPKVSKLVPRMKDTAKILYLIYFGMTIADPYLTRCARRSGQPERAASGSKMTVWRAIALISRMCAPCSCCCSGSTSAAIIC